MTTLEADHLDIYGSFEGVREAFDSVLALVPRDGLIALCSDDDGAKKLAKNLGLDTVGDLLRHYPRRYEKRGDLTKLAELVERIAVRLDVAVDDPQFHEIRKDIEPTQVLDALDERRREEGLEH